MGEKKQGGATTKKTAYLVGLLVLVVAVGIGGVLWNLYGKNKHADRTKAQAPQKVRLAADIKSDYDVIVVGTDPEGVTAAVSAARNGLKTLMIDGNNRKILGGLMTLGWLNTIDLNEDRDKPHIGGVQVLNKGLFSEWFKKVEGDSFDVNTAANAFNEMVGNEKNIDVALGLKSFEPVTAEGSAPGTKKMTAMKFVTADGKTMEVKAKAFIDATQDGDIAAQAGVPFTFGREDLGDKDARMAVTLVFKLKNVTPDVWKQIKKHLADDGLPSTGANDLSAWGYVEMQKYPPLNKERVKMRGLNIGRQNDDTALVNALQIFGVNPLDSKSRQEAFDIGKKELPNVMEYMKKLYPEFKDVDLADTAPELYVRESRHIQGEYRLSIIDVLESRDQWDRIGFGSYPVDIQRTSPADNGAVVTQPDKYAIPFRSIVPKQVDGLLVVGRSASYDTLPHGSARVIPTGMAEGEAAGAAARLAIDKQLSFRELSSNKELIANLQDQLNKQGMEIKPYTPKKLAFMDDKTYPGLKTAVSLGLATGGYSNTFELEKPSNAKRMANLVGGAKKINKAAFKGDPGAAIADFKDTADKTPLTLQQACYTVTQALGMKVPLEAAQTELLQKGLLQQSTIDLISDKNSLTNGESYMMIKDLKEALKP